MLKSSTLLRYLLSLIGILLSIPILALVTLAFITPVTVSGILYLFGSILLASGLILTPWQLKTRNALVLGGLIVILSVIGLRLYLTLNETSNLKVIVLPSTRGTRPLNALIDEQDTLLFGEGLLRLIGGVSPHEHEGLALAVTAAYQEARVANGVFSSPVLSTYIGFQKPDAFDVVVIEPSAERPSPVGIIFLHGFTGNVSIQCWQIARAVDRIDAVTVCPSTNWIGEWWLPDGEAIIRETFGYLREKSIQRIYLGGFSNGGGGVGRLISILADEPELSGLFFIAGVRNAQAVRETGLPVLVIQGANDERIPVEAARQFVADLGEGVTYVELEADHFLIMKQTQAVQEAISAWLLEQEKTLK